MKPNAIQVNPTEAEFEKLALANGEFHRPIFDGIVDEPRFRKEKIKPSVMICGGTGHLFANLYGFQAKPLVERGPAYCKHAGYHWILAYHPGQTTTSREAYVNGITMTIKPISDTQKCLDL